jgi:hypothetical protein
MTTSRLAILLAVMLGAMSTVFLLPKHLAYQPLGIELALPEYLGEWHGSDVGISDRERQVLGAETEFARKSYTNGRGDELQVSIVLGGQDMNTSIHRPERCLPAQGWTITNKGPASVVLPGKGSLMTTRLHNLRNITGPRRKTTAGLQSELLLVHRPQRRDWFTHGAHDHRYQRSRAPRL